MDYGLDFSIHLVLCIFQLITFGQLAVPGLLHSAHNSLAISSAVFKPLRYCVEMLSNSSDRCIFILQLHFLLSQKKSLSGGILLNYNVERKGSVWGAAASVAWCRYSPGSD